MRILVLSDIHANRSALEAVLDDAGAVDAVWCLGDLVGYGPDPNECIALIRALPNLVCLLGNHDAAALGQIDLNTFNSDARLSIRWMQTTLTPDSIEFLKSLPEKQVIGDVTLAHGSPRNPVWEYILDVYTAMNNFDYFDTRFCFVGHSHLPIAYLANPESNSIKTRLLKMGDSVTVYGRALLNPGSVGQPRDHDFRAAYALFEPEEQRWSARRVAYDFVAVQDRIQRAGLPQRHAARLAEGA